MYGERLVDRLEFEELALKSIDPSLGPKLSDLVLHKSKPKPSDAPMVRHPLSPFMRVPIR